MSEGPLQGTAFFSRKIQPVQYESAEASHFVQYEIGVEGAVEAAFAEAKAHVLNQLGIKYHFDDAGVIVEVSPVDTAVNVATAFPNSAPAAAPAAAPAPASGRSQIKVSKRITDAAGNAVANPSWLEPAMLSAGISEVWDNRSYLPAFGGTGNPKRAWFSEKVAKGEQGKGFWPPRDHADAAASYVHPAFASDPRSTPNADEESF